MVISDRNREHWREMEELEREPGCDTEKTRGAMDRDNERGRSNEFFGNSPSFPQSRQNLRILQGKDCTRFLPLAIVRQ